MEEWYWVFRDKKTGRIDISRHSRPDFVAGYPDEGHIKLDYDRMLIRFQKNRFDFEATANNSDFKTASPKLKHS